MKRGISTITFICEFHGCNKSREEAITKYKSARKHYCSRTCAAKDQKKLTDLPGSEHLTLKETADKYNLTYSCLVSRRHDADDTPPKKYFNHYMPVLPYKSNPGYRERGW